MKHVASLSEFVPDTSRSVYNARINKADFADFGTQKYCIVIVDSVTTLLNPGQAIVDASDQPVYALSKRL